MASPLRILCASTKTAAQNCTARLPAKTSVSGACHGYTPMSNDLFVKGQTFSRTATSGLLKVRREMLDFVKYFAETVAHGDRRPRKASCQRSDRSIPAIQSPLHALHRHIAGGFARYPLFSQRGARAVRAG